MAIRQLIRYTKICIERQLIKWLIKPEKRGEWEVSRKTFRKLLTPFCD